ncbi:unnamed protein product [Chrysoparadoxa australica]
METWDVVDSGEPAASGKGASSAPAKERGKRRDELSGSQMAHCFAQLFAERARFDAHMAEEFAKLSRGDRRLLETEMPEFPLEYFPSEEPAGKKRKKKQKKDPNAPKKPKTAYISYVQHCQQRFREQNHDLNKDTFKEIAELWKKETDEGKRPFIEAAEQAKKEYLKEMEAYKTQVPKMAESSEWKP